MPFCGLFSRTIVTLARKPVGQKLASKAARKIRATPRKVSAVAAGAKIKTKIVAKKAKSVARRTVKTVTRKSKAVAGRAARVPKTAAKKKKTVQQKKKKPTTVVAGSKGKKSRQQTKAKTSQKKKNPATKVPAPAPKKTGPKSNAQKKKKTPNTAIAGAAATTTATAVPVCDDILAAAVEVAEEDTLTLLGQRPVAPTYSHACSTTSETPVDDSAAAPDLTAQENFQETTTTVTTAEDAPEEVNADEMAMDAERHYDATESQDMQAETLNAADTAELTQTDEEPVAPDQIQTEDRLDAATADAATGDAAEAVRVDDVLAHATALEPVEALIDRVEGEQPTPVASETLVEDRSAFVRAAGAPATAKPVAPPVEKAEPATMESTESKDATTHSAPAPLF